jgi:exopolysaccharide/PEP-CTERM locus tyrosine autokinase
MSKIQDALRKLQTDPINRQSRSSGEKKTNPVGKVNVASRTEDDAKTSNPKAPSVTVDFELLREAELLAPERQQRHIADQYRLIKRPLLNNVLGQSADQSENANLIMVASALSGDGKTFNCINLALSMATEKDMSVVLVDADVAKPHVSKLFGLENEPGLIDVLVKPDCDVGEVIAETNIPGLQILPAGRHDDNAAELLASQRMKSVIDVMSRRYPDRIVIFDSPPLLQTSEARVLASLMGQIVLVIRSGATPQHAVQAAYESLDPDKAISVILNQSNKGFGGESYGSYGYGRYGS